MMPQRKSEIPLPEDTILLDQRYLLRAIVKHVLIRPRIHRLLGHWLTTALFKMFNLEAI